MRSMPWLVAVALIGAGCSNGGDQASGDDVGTTSHATTSPPTATVVAEAPLTTVPLPVPTVRLSVSSPALGVTADLRGVVGEAPDPFGDFATCSGQADRIGAYAVGVGDADGSVRWLSVVTVDRVTGPGDYEADVRIELGTGNEIVAVGTVTLDRGLVTGSYRAFTATGSPVVGEFECERPGAATTSSPDDRFVEVVVLLQRDAAERVLVAISDDPSIVDCPGGIGGESLIVGIDGESPATGSISRFVLIDDAAGGSLDLVAGDASYTFDRVDLTLADDRRSGTYAATAADGLAVDGAFSCVAG